MAMAMVFGSPLQGVVDELAMHRVEESLSGDSVLYQGHNMLTEYPCDFASAAPHCNVAQHQSLVFGEPRDERCDRSRRRVCVCTKSRQDSRIGGISINVSRF